MKIVKCPPVSYIRHYTSPQLFKFLYFFVLLHLNIFDITGSDLKPWGQELRGGLHDLYKAPEVGGNSLCKYTIVIFFHNEDSTEFHLLIIRFSNCLQSPKFKDSLNMVTSNLYLKINLF